MDSLINNALGREQEEVEPTRASLKVHTPELSKTRDVDAELEEIINSKKATIKVFGVGGAGNNTLMRMSEVGIKGAELIAINTDAQDLLCVIADRKILIGKELTGGLGAGNNPQIGREAAKESTPDIKKSLENADMAFVTCGMGGGTGTGAAPVIAEVAKKSGALTVGVVTMPFTIEGKVRQENAIEGLERMQESVDTLIVIPNDKLLEIANDLPLHTAFKVADEILTNAVKGIAELVTRTGLINLDFADIKAVMQQGGVAMIGVGESDTEHRAVEAVEKAVTNPLLDVDIAGAKGALINVIGGPSMSLDEAKQVVETISDRLDVGANVIWGAQLASDMKDALRVMLVVTGVTSPQIFGFEKTVTTQRKTEMGNELGIEFID